MFKTLQFIGPAYRVYHFQEVFALVSDNQLKRLQGILAEGDDLSDAIRWMRTRNILLIENAGLRKAEYFHDRENGRIFHLSVRSESENPRLSQVYIANFKVCDEVSQRYPVQKTRVVRENPKKNQATVDNRMTLFHPPAFSGSDILSTRWADSETMS